MPSGKHTPRCPRALQRTSAEPSRQTPNQSASFAIACAHKKNLFVPSSRTVVIPNADFRRSASASAHTLQRRHRRIGQLSDAPALICLVHLARDITHRTASSPPISKRLGAESADHETTPREPQGLLSLHRPHRGLSAPRSRLSHARLCPSTTDAPSTKWGQAAPPNLDQHHPPFPQANRHPNR